MAVKCEAVLTMLAISLADLRSLHGLDCLMGSGRPCRACFSMAAWCEEMIAAWRLRLV